MRSNVTNIHVRAFRNEKSKKKNKSVILHEVFMEYSKDDCYMYEFPSMYMYAVVIHLKNGLALCYKMIDTLIWKS